MLRLARLLCPTYPCHDADGKQQQRKEVTGKDKRVDCAASVQGLRLRRLERHGGAQAARGGGDPTSEIAVKLVSGGIPSASVASSGIGKD